MVNRVSALNGHYNIGGAGDAGVVLEEVPYFSITQLAAWPETLSEVRKKIAEVYDVDDGTSDAVLRIEPLKYWVITKGNPAIEYLSMSPDVGVMLEITHSKVWIKASGSHAETLLNHFLPLDLRDGAFPMGHVASSAMHHVGVTLWKNDSGYNLFIPRSFALSLWQMLCESAEQYGLRVQ